MRNPWNCKIMKPKNSLLVVMQNKDNLFIKGWQFFGYIYAHNMNYQSDF